MIFLLPQRKLYIYIYIKDENFYFTLRNFSNFFVKVQHQFKKMLSVCFLIIITVSFCGSTNNCTAPNTLITFDDLPATGYPGVLIPADYYNLTWSDVYYLTSANTPNSGYPTALSSGQNVAYNGYGNTMSITSPSTNGSFSISSFIASSAWNDNLHLAIVGQLNGTTVYNGSIILQVTSASLVTLNWLNLDTIFFTTSGGTTNAMVSAFGEEFAMDNLCINL
jgi:hypothetical protein